MLVESSERRIAKLRLFRLSFVGVCLLGLLTHLQSARAQSGVQGGSITGIVIDSATGKPVGEAVVTVSQRPTQGAAGTSSARRQLTDEAGRFAFRDCAPGSYTLSVTKLGYFPGGYGRTRQDGPLQVIELSPAQSRDLGKTLLWRWSEITGTVHDEFGDPVAGANVRAFPVKHVAGAVKYSSLALSLSAKTDDRGEFRIAALPPGTYAVAVLSTLVTIPNGQLDDLTLGEMRSAAESPVGGYGGLSAAALRQSGEFSGARVMSTDLDQVVLSLGPLRTADDRIKVPLMTFYPGTDEPPNAQPVQVRGYGDSVDASFVVRRKVGVEFAGSVRRGDDPIGGAFIRLVRQPDMFESTFGLDVAATVSAGDGAFRFVGVPPGRYLLVSSLRTGSRTDSALRMRTATGDVRIPDALLTSTRQDMLWEVQPITVGREAIAQFTVRLSPGPRVTGQLDIRADDPKPFSKEFGSTVISFQPSDGLRLAGPWSSRVQADGTFASDNLPPGSYFMTVTGLPPGWSFVSAEVRGRDYSLESFEAAEITGPVSIVIERAEAVASGAVSGLSGDSRCTVLVFPTNRSLWTLLPGWQRRFRSGTVAPSGTYRISGLVAGEYWMVAVIGGDAERLADPSYLGMLTGKSTRVTIERGKSLTVALQAQR